MKAGDGFGGVRLSVPVFERTADEQPGLLDPDARADDSEFDHLVERLKARMGRGAVLFAQPAESHLPEKTCRLVEEATPMAPPRVTAEARPPKARPLHLLALPAEVRCMAAGDGPPVSFAYGGGVFNAATVAGPERIAGPWWEGRNKTRDYFDVEDAGGRRFWLFRVAETRKWYLHGLFDC